MSEFIGFFRDNPKSVIYGLGAGRMGFSLKAFIMRLGHLGFNSYMIGDTTIPMVKKNHLVIINSSSGETRSILLLAKIAKSHGAKIVTTTTNSNSSIAKISDIILKISNVDSTQIMKTIYEQSTYLLYDIIIKEIIQELELDIDTINKNHSVFE